MLSGLIIGGEFSLYSGIELAGIFGGCLVCCLGILVLVMKSSQIDFKDKKHASEIEDDKCAEKLIDQE